MGLCWLHSSCIEQNCYIIFLFPAHPFAFDKKASLLTGNYLFLLQNSLERRHQSPDFSLFLGNEKSIILPDTKTTLFQYVLRQYLYTPHSLYTFYQLSNYLSLQCTELLFFRQQNRVYRVTTVLVRVGNRIY
jgi:hypothetical protein